MADKDKGGAERIRIWDRPTRIFHWLLVLLSVVCYASGSLGRLDVHMVAGQALLVLVAARILWGLAGGESARFRSFLRPPREILAYLPGLAKREPDGYPGHNPLGGLAVLAMLLAFLLQAGLGLFAIDIDGLYEGPLSLLVSYDAAREAADWHAMTVDLLLALVALHLAAIAFHWLYKRENLVTAMITGRAALPRTAAPRTVPDWRALVCLLLAALLVLGGIELAIGLLF